MPYAIILAIILILTFLITPTPAQDPQYLPPDIKTYTFYPPKAQGDDTVTTIRPGRLLPGETTNKAWVIPTRNGKPHGTAIAYHPNGDTAGVYNFQVGDPVGLCWHDNPCLHDKPQNPFDNYCRVSYVYQTPGQLAAEYRDYWDDKGNPSTTILRVQADGSNWHGTMTLFYKKAPYYSAQYYHGLRHGIAYHLNTNGYPTDSLRFFMGKQVPIQDH